MVYHIAVCENDPNCAVQLQKMMEEILAGRRMAFSCDRYTACEQLEAAVMSPGTQHHILFLDTVLDGKDGVAFAEKLRDSGLRSPIVFISSDEKSALAAYAAAPVHYLLRPVRKQELHTALCRAFRQYEDGSVCIIETAGRGITVLAVCDIFYLEVFNKMILVHCRDGGTLTAAGPLTDFFRRLPAGRFYACHRCYVVNFSCVRRLRRNEFVLEDGSVIPVARRRYQDALCAWKNYLEEEKMI
ncbi:LytTR family DNA-binding domain-containing protein [Clostridium sp. KNHs216]|uniref:LytR/AlgR family response regulator transcription factor n=1 Tax=Clostridium sp. KNHs216 TaxID=1550235 RepID=UPI00114E3CB5|nr:LytTR family DNA-binding domain-containing protein [Clostridium sp. KNHs216]TQI68736.1 LytTR family two component transcriptional regulator [Clostridium sp. KNHs216]